jgi:hypothetical protein
LLEQLKKSSSYSEQRLICQKICQQGILARLAAIKDVLNIDHRTQGMAIICDLIDGAETGVEAIYEHALALLAENEMESSTWYLCELTHVIAPRVSRTSLKEAMLKCLIKSPKQREDIVYTLHKNGFRDV